MDATISSAGGSTSRELSQSGSTDAPLPVLGLRGIWRLPHDFYFTAQAQSFYIDYDDYKGSLSDLKATIAWQATPRFGVGLGYNDFRFRFDLDKSLFRRPAALELWRRHGVRVAHVLKHRSWILGIRRILHAEPPGPAAAIRPEHDRGGRCAVGKVADQYAKHAV